MCYKIYPFKGIKKGEKPTCKLNDKTVRRCDCSSFFDQDLTSFNFKLLKTILFKKLRIMKFNFKKKSFKKTFHFLGRNFVSFYYFQRKINKKSCIHITKKNFFYHGIINSITKIIIDKYFY